MSLPELKTHTHTVSPVTRNPRGGHSSPLRTLESTVDFPQDTDTSSVAQICAIINTGISARATHWGSGRHFDDLTPAQKSKVIHYNLAAFCPSILSIGIPKLAVVALLTKLLEPARWHRITMWTAAGATNLLLFGCVIILYAQCQPARSQWDFSVEGQCWSPWVLVYWAIVSGSVFFFFFSFLPLLPES